MTTTARSTRPKPFAPWDLSRPAVYRFEVTRVDAFPWVAWIPPRGPQDYDGVPPDAPILAPYGDSYWPTWDEAIAFVARVTRDHVTVPDGMRQCDGCGRIEDAGTAPDQDGAGRSECCWEPDTVTVPASLLAQLATGCDRLADELDYRADGSTHPHDRNMLCDEASGWRQVVERAAELTAETGS